MVLFPFSFFFFFILEPFSFSLSSLKTLFQMLSGLVVRGWGGESITAFTRALYATTRTSLQPIDAGSSGTGIEEGKRREIHRYMVPSGKKIGDISVQQNMKSFMLGVDDSKEVDHPTHVRPRRAWFLRKKVIPYYFFKKEIHRVRQDIDVQRHYRKKGIVTHKEYYNQPH